MIFVTKNRLPVVGIVPAVQVIRLRPPGGCLGVQALVDQPVDPSDTCSQFAEEHVAPVRIQRINAFGQEGV
jgi:hypothetical protein